MPISAEQPYDIRAHRFQHSPFYDAYAVAGTLVGVYNRRLYPWKLDDDVVANYWTLRRAAAMYDVPETPLEIVGPDAERLLNKVLTRDISKLKTGRATYGLACLADGGILMDGVLMRLAPDRFFYVQADGDFLGWLMAHGLEMDVEVSDPKSWVLQIQGPKALDILRDAAVGGGPEPFRYFDVATCRIGGQDVVVSRTGWTNEMGFELYTLGEVDGPKLWADLLAAGEPHGLIGTGLDSMGIRRIEGGILDNGTDMDPSMTPFQAGLGKFVDFAKQDFIGRAALEGAERTCLLFGLKVPDAAPVRGARVLSGGKPVGWTTTGAWSPYLNHGVGYVRFDGPGFGPGDRVTLRLPDGGEHAAEVVELPFYDAEKLIPRGLSNERV
jgi:aminomethyltransferase